MVHELKQATFLTCKGRHVKKWRLVTKYVFGYMYYFCRVREKKGNLVKFKMHTKWTFRHVRILQYIVADLNVKVFKDYTPCMLWSYKKNLLLTDRLVSWASLIWSIFTLSVLKFAYTSCICWKLIFNWSSFGLLWLTSFKTNTGFCKRYVGEILPWMSFVEFL